jgi:DNA (cytosine-5)-methyltransferase 1
MSEFKLPSGLKLKHRDKLLPADWTLPDARNIESVLKDVPTLEPGEEKNEYFCEPGELAKEKEIGYVEYLRADDPELTQHKASNNTEKMRKRLAFAGTSRDDLPEYIFPSSGYSSTYSRLRRDEPSSTLTTNFTTASSTRCIHPYENRALSLREGARIQSFPDSFEFTGSKGEIRQQIGNAVPPLLGRAIGATVVDLINQTEV